MDYPPHLLCPGDQHLSSPIPLAYIPEGGELDPDFVWDDFNVARLENNINGERTLRDAYIPDGSTITWTVTDSKGQQTSCSFELHLKAAGMHDADAFLAPLRLYPNPASDHFLVESSHPLDKITVRAITGNTVRQVEPGGRRKVRVETLHHPAGVYIVIAVDSRGYQGSELLFIR